jgi:hypothetical protein
MIQAKRSPWRTAQFDTIRLRLIKIAARVDELKKRVRVRLPTACPDQPILRFCVERLIPMPESSDLSLMTDKVGKGWFSMLCHRLVWCTDAAVARADDVG